MPDLKNILISKWHLIQNQPQLREIYKESPLLSYRKGRSLKDALVRVLEQSFEGQSFPILTNRSRVWNVIHFDHRQMKSFENDRAHSHGGATSQRSKMNFTVTTFKTMVNTKKPIISKILSQSPF